LKGRREGRKKRKGKTKKKKKERENKKTHWSLGSPSVMENLSG